MAEARRLTRGSKREDAVHAAGNEMFDEPFQPVQVEGISIPQGRDHGGDDAAEQPGAGRPTAASLSCSRTPQYTRARIPHRCAARFQSEPFRGETKVDAA